MTPHHASDDDDTPQRRYSDHHPADPPDISHRAPLFVAIFTLIAFIFSIGVNYQKLASVSDSFTQFVTDANNIYVRRDVQSEQIQSLQTEIEMLRYEVQDLKVAMNARAAVAATRPAPSEPRLERK